MSANNNATTFEWSDWWVGDWIVPSIRETWSVAVGTRGLTEPQIIRRLDGKIREAMGRRVATITIKHDPWAGRGVRRHLDEHTDISFVFRRSDTQTLAHLRPP